MITRTTCRVCEGQLDTVLSLGSQFISGFIPPDEGSGRCAPLELTLCRQCTLLQLRHTVSADSMYKNYWYRSGTNQTMRLALADIAHVSERLMNLCTEDTVLDIGCNDGTLLVAYETEDLFRIGFDPAKNLTAISSLKADSIVCDFFSAEEFYRNFTTEFRPHIITSIAMFYDLEDPNKFVHDIKEVMHPEGLWVVQMSYLPSMLKQHDFGNICHEHLEYYSLKSLEYLLDRHEMEVVDIQLNDVNGGSFRAFIRNRGADRRLFADATYRNLASERVWAMRAQEATMDLGRLKTYLDFVTWIERIRNDVFNFTQHQVRMGKKVAIYGASTKGNVMLQYFGLDNHLISFASERNPDKWGLLTAGSRIPIVPEDQARAAKPDYFLILPWHFLEEFRTREKDYLLGGGRFIVPLPHFTLI